MFKPGDLVKRIRGISGSCPSGGIYTVDRISYYGGYISVVEDPLTGILHDASNFELYSHIANTAFKTEYVKKLLAMEFSNSINTIVCDCGGFKTFGSMDSASHSPWCSSQKAKGQIIVYKYR